MLQWLRLHAKNAGGLGSILGQGTISHMLQLRVCMPQLKIPHIDCNMPHGRQKILSAITNTQQHNQINNLIIERAV